MSICALLAAQVPGAAAQGSSAMGGCDPCDTNCDQLHDLLDIDPFVESLLNGAAGCSPCSCDLDADGEINGRDTQPFVDCLLSPAGACCIAATSCMLGTQSNCTGLWMGPATDCQSISCAFGNLTAYRPQHRTGYFPFAKTAVSEGDEESSTAGPGIRINAPGDSDPQGEDDLIELLVQTSRPDIELALARDNGALRVWTTRTKIAGTEVPFINDRTSSLPLAGGLTLWVEWAAPARGLAELRLEPLGAAMTLDTLRFHAFRTIVMALGGESQVPSVPVDPNHGTFVVGIALYQRGFDVHMHDEDDVDANGLGPAYTEIVNAVTHRMVDQISFFGYSHGGGSTHDLAERLDNDRPGIGVFDILATSYVDGVENDSDFDVQQELRRPPSSGYHANHYQVGSFSDFGLDGGPVPNSDPPPTGRNMEGTQGGQEVTHFLVDDYLEVRTFIEMNLAARLTP